MDKKVTSIVAYITIIGWLVAYFAGDRENAKFHLNQGLVVSILGLANGILASIFGVLCIAVPFLLVFTGIFSIIGLGILALAIIGIVYAYNGEDKELPVIGQFKILK